MSDNLTTTQAAEMLCVSVTVIQRLCDSGSLKCWRIPGSKHRRIERKEVLKMMRSEGWPQEMIRKFE